MRGISGEKGSLITFGKAIDTVTTKLNTLSNSFGSSNTNAGNISFNPTINVSVSGSFDVSRAGKVIFEQREKEVMTGVSPKGGGNGAGKGC